MEPPAWLSAPGETAFRCLTARLVVRAGYSSLPLHMTTGSDVCAGHSVESALAKHVYRTASPYSFRPGRNQELPML